MTRTRTLQSSLAVLVITLATAVSAATWRVGPTGNFQTPCQAFASSQVVSGDTIEIAAGGNYAGDVCVISKSNLTIRGVGGRPMLDAAGRHAQGKGIWVIQGANTVVENIEFANASVPDSLGANGAGIRQEGRNLTVRRCYFHHNQNGILATVSTDSEITIEHSEFAYNGNGRGDTHNVYIVAAARLTFRYNYSHHAVVGHLLKSRALENHILYNRLTNEETGRASYELDLPYGGIAYVIGNLFHQANATENRSMLAYGKESSRTRNELYVVNNTFVSTRSAGATFVDIVTARISTPALIQNNIFFSTVPATITTQSSARQVTNFTGDPRFVDRTNYNYRLRSDSPCINAGTAPGSANGVDLTPRYQYVHPASREPRPIVGAIDIGAYEAGSSGSLATILVRASGDHYQGSPQLMLLVDGAQVGQTQTVTAVHGQGQWQELTFTADLTNKQTIAVAFINDAWGGTPDTDRNLWIDHVMVDGVVHAPTDAVYYRDGRDPLQGQSSMENEGRLEWLLPDPTPPTVVVRASGDHYQGSPQFMLLVDGVPVGQTRTVTATHSQGQWQEFGFAVDLTDKQTIAIAFINDAWGGTPDTDRNLWIDHVTVNGVVHAPADAIYYRDGQEPLQGQSRMGQAGRLEWMSRGTPPGEVQP